LESQKKNHSGKVLYRIFLIFLKKKTANKTAKSYYRVNQGGSVALLEAMARANCTNIIFSSSATVYQPAKTIDDLPLSEESPTGGTTNPYARSKLHVEEILADACIANSNLSVVNLRYFNPVGAHESGLIGEDPRGIPNNLMPFVSQVAIGRRPHLNVFGNDYQTHDGTGMMRFVLSLS
jgi:UDP-glucose 4-epimerase